jgi:uncharacterized oxidoreductase
MIEYPAYSLAGRRVLVTGASSGIGIPLAVEAARRGASLILSGRDEERLVQTAELCVAESGDGPMPELLALDLIDLDERRALAAACQDVDVAVLNAGLLLGGPFERHDDERILALLRLNVEAPLHLARLLAEGLEERAGALVLISSGVGRQPLPYNVVYNTSKVAVTSFGRALALEWQDRGRQARVLVSHPGATQTPMLEGVDAEKRSPDSVATGTYDALEAGKSLWWAAGEEPELLEQYAREEARALERAPSLKVFFGSVR